VVARKMIQMTRYINTDWKKHVASSGPTGANGVTCYTCHRGAPVPAQVWFTYPGYKQTGGGSAESAGQNHPSVAAAYSSMSLDPLTPYLLGNASLRAAGTTALPTYTDPAQRVSVQQTEGTFGLMMHMSQALGVNCTHCHNTRSHAQWEGSPLTRTTAFYGINMARELNNNYLVPLTKTFPANRLGPTGDVAKISCATCHQGIYRPLKGAPLLKDHPAAFGGGGLVASAAADASAVPTAAVTAVSTKAAKR
jgi:photosynthetic reaction center cytochrome c subunit